MREVVLRVFGQYKLKEDGTFYNRILEHNELGEVTGESWREAKQNFGKCDYRGGGYYVVSASIGKLKTHRTHRLVAKHFVPGYKPGLHVNHIDGNRSNNHAINLEWVTHDENMKNAVARGVLGKHMKYSGKLTAEQVLTIITLINAGKSNAEIAAQYDIDPSNISKLRHKNKRSFPELHHLIDNPLKKSYCSKRRAGKVSPRGNDGKFLRSGVSI